MYPETGHPAAPLADLPAPPALTGVELGRFRLRPGADEATMRTAWQQMVSGHLRQQPGWQGQYLLQLEEDLFIDLALAESPHQARLICASWQHQPLCEAFLALIEPVSMEFAGIVDSVRP